MSKQKKTQNHGTASTDKIEAMEVFREEGAGQTLTTNQGVPINDNQNSLKAGNRGPSLLEDFILREKITHFDHERIPERIVHARGAAAHGYFQVYESLAPYTRAKFLQDPAVQTPVFVRFSTVAGFRGSTDLARDVRGFAVKFYTEEGNFDLVGNNIPVFFIQDAIKFPDLIHAVKPEPHNEIPQAASAHDTFWDFISLVPESMHMIMWAMSDRALPRSYRMMEGFGVHTFRLINAEGKGHLVKFHWKPLLGVHSVLWDEAQKISGKDPDFHRRDLWDAIESGSYPAWELGLQIVTEEDEHSFDFDLLDPTKLIPEEVVPVKRVGKLTLNRNPDNFFAETEQVAFHPGHLVPGIDFTNDPLLQGRLFSYTDTQLSRLGSPNFHELPINRTLAPVHNNQRDAHMRQTINKGRVSYEPNSIGGGCPMQAKADWGGFVSYMEKMEGHKVRERSASFFDHYSQARLFYSSQSAPEQDHIVNALRFELGMVAIEEIRQRMLVHLAHIDGTLASRVAEGLGMTIPAALDKPLNMSIPADGDVAAHQPKPVNQKVQPSPALSMANTIKDTVKSRRVAVLVADGVNAAEVEAMQHALAQAGAQAFLIAPRLGTVKSSDGKQLKADYSLLTAASVFFDGVYVPGGDQSVTTLQQEADAIHFLNEAYRHCKTIAATGAGLNLLRNSYLQHHSAVINANGQVSVDEGIVVAQESKSKDVVKVFLQALAHHRHWEREMKAKVPA
ncbi:MAG: catalase HPII [Caldilineaceae bacterium]|nr:catalase HPII [Caldilineaceae bacterium]